jgi:hypothetical protein
MAGAAKVDLGPEYDFGGDVAKYSRLLQLSGPDCNASCSQSLFARGLLWAFAFFHEESVRCFTAAADEIPCPLVCCSAFAGK